MMEWEFKNFSKISIENDELILEWEKGRSCATKVAFALEDIAAIGLNLKKSVKKESKDE